VLKRNWDYSWAGLYYITIICTGGRALYFGDIVGEEMVLSKIGKIANTYWLAIPEHFGFVNPDTYQIMPNHIHGLIEINNPVGALHATPLQDSNTDSNKIKNEQMATISPKAGSLSTVIRSFKSAVTKDARIIDAEFYWQSRFYDSIVRDDQSLVRIRQYIKNNPKNWIEDKMKPPNSNEKK